MTFPVLKYERQGAKYSNYSTFATHFFIKVGTCGDSLAAAEAEEAEGGDFSDGGMLGSVQDSLNGFFLEKHVVCSESNKIETNLSDSK